MGPIQVGNTRSGSVVDLSMPTAVPGSLVPLRWAAPASVVLIALCTLLDVLGGDHELWVGLLLFAGPTATFAVALSRPGGDGGQRFWRVMLAGMVLQVVLGVLVVAAIGADPLAAVVTGVCMAVFFCFFAVILVPLLIGATAFHARRSHDDGDAMLAVGGAWVAIVQGVVLLLSTHDFVWRVPGLVLGVAAVVVSVVRGRRRREWCRRVERGAVAGLRVRPPASLAELLHLPAVYGPSEHASAVIERVSVGLTPYRSAHAYEAIATLPTHAARRP